MKFTSFMRILILIFICLVSSASLAQQNFTETSKSNSTGELDGEKIFTLSDKMASFPGGHNGWTKYVEKNVDYLIPHKQNAPPGRYNVIIRFVIDQKGEVSNIEPLTRHGFGMEAELIRIIEKGPRWSPAVQKGKAVKSYRKQPLTFIVRSN